MDYLRKILDKIASIPRCSMQAIPCEVSWNEGTYNENFERQNSCEYSLFDKHNFHVTSWGKSKV